MGLKETSALLRTCLDEAHALGLPYEDVDNIDVLLSAGEIGVAFEDLCTQLDEHCVPLIGSLRRMIHEVGEATGLDPSRWMDF